MLNLRNEHKSIPPFKNSTKNVLNSQNIFILSEEADRSMIQNPYSGLIYYVVLKILLLGSIRQNMVQENVLVIKRG